jgi:hypothetical protein
MLSVVPLLFPFSKSVNILNNPMLHSLSIEQQALITIEQDGTPTTPSGSLCRRVSFQYQSQQNRHSFINGTRWKVAPGYVIFHCSPLFVRPSLIFLLLPFNMSMCQSAHVQNSFWTPCTIYMQLCIWHPEFNFHRLRSQRTSFLLLSY